jgi:hypothetical protein
VQLRVDGLRAQRLHRPPAPVDERFADRERCLDPTVLCEFPIEIGLDVAAGELAHDDGSEVRQQVDLQLPLHVGQAVGAQSLSDLALVVLVGELRNGRDFRFDVVGLQRRRPGPGQDLARDQPGLVLGARARHAFVAASEVDPLVGVGVAAEADAVAHHAVAVGVLADLPRGSPWHGPQIATGEGERAMRLVQTRSPLLAVPGPPVAAVAGMARR